MSTSTTTPKAPNTRRLRRALLAGAALLLLLVAGFFVAARIRRLAFHLDLPGRLGADIAQTANGFTYSQSEAGHTLFTIHAASITEFKRDEAELKDATVTLYGPAGSNRSDRIAGADFFYNRKSGTVRAPGAVTIDFAPPARGASPGSSKAPESIHVTTSGLTFTQATGEAVTDARVDFATSRATGSSTGAHYSSKTGLLVLDHDVALTVPPEPGAPANSLPTVVHAAHAQLLRDQHRALLDGDDTTSDGGRLTSDHATVDFRPDGSAEHLLAEGHVRLLTPEGANVRAGTGQADLDEASQPTLAVLTGGVTYDAQEQGEITTASAGEGTLSFSPAAVRGSTRGRESLRHAQFRQAVHVLVTHAGLPGDARGHSTRELHSPTLDVDFAPGAAGKAEAQKAVATGGGTVLDLRDYPGPAGAGVHGTTVRGDSLVALVVDGHQVRTLDGTGHTEVVDLAADGTVSNSRGNTLHAIFTRAEGDAGGGADTIETAVQEGGVLLTQTPPPGARNTDGTARAPMHATGEHGEYHAADQMLRLTGSPQAPPHLWNDATELTATRVNYHRDSGDAEAWGDVRATDNSKPQSGPAPAVHAGPTLGGDGPVHITADHARLLHAQNTSYFYAGANARPEGYARLWQGADQVNAPVLILNRAGNTLDARATDDLAQAGTAPVVHATFAPRADPGRPAAAPRPANRIVAATLHYSDVLHRADFDGAVTATEGYSTTRSHHSTAFFTTPAPGKPSQLERIVASGDVVLTQPGRRATGEQLVYTAATERYLLTGTAAAPPRAVDRDHGTTTGAALQFTDNADQEVEILGRAPGEKAGNGTVTDTTSPH